jgi:hypothetical protein
MRICTLLIFYCFLFTQCAFAYQISDSTAHKIPIRKSPVDSSKQKDVIDIIHSIFKKDKKTVQ